MVSVPLSGYAEEEKGRPISFHPSPLPILTSLRHLTAVAPQYQLPLRALTSNMSLNSSQCTAPSSPSSTSQIISSTSFCSHTITAHTTVSVFTTTVLWRLSHPSIAARLQPATCLVPSLPSS